MAIGFKNKVLKNIHGRTWQQQVSRRVRLGCTLFYNTADSTNHELPRGRVMVRNLQVFSLVRVIQNDVKSVEMFGNCHVNNCVNNYILPPLIFSRFSIHRSLFVGYTLDRSPASILSLAQYIISLNNREMTLK